MSEFNSGVYFIHFVNEFMEFVNWLRPNKEYVVDEWTVIEWDKVLLGEEFILNISHECVSISGSEFGSHCCAIELFITFVVKFKG